MTIAYTMRLAWTVCLFQCKYIFNKSFFSTSFSGRLVGWSVKNNIMYYSSVLMKHHRTVSSACLFIRWFLSSFDRTSLLFVMSTLSYYLILAMISPRWDAHFGGKKSLSHVRNTIGAMFSLLVFILFQYWCITWSSFISFICDTLLLTVPNVSFFLTFGAWQHIVSGNLGEQNAFNSIININHIVADSFTQKITTNGNSFNELWIFSLESNFL